MPELLDFMKNFEETSQQCVTLPDPLDRCSEQTVYIDSATLKPTEEPEGLGGVLDFSSREVTPTNKDQYPMGSKTVFERLLILAETLLGYAHLQVTSEKRCIQDINELRKTVYHLRSIFDSGNAAERNYIDTLNDVSQTLKKLDTQYYESKEYAKSLLIMCREDRDVHRERCNALRNRLQDAETELFSAEELCSQQKKELMNLEHCSQMNHAGDLEISQLRGSVAQLEDQNQVLEKEIQSLKQKIAVNQERLLQAMYGGLFGVYCMIKCGSSQTSYIEDADHATTITLQKTIEKLEAESLLKRKEFEHRVALEKERVTVAKQKAAELLELCEKLQSCGTSR